MSKNPISRSLGLDNSTRLHLGNQLRVMYGDPAGEKLPRDLARLAYRVYDVLRIHEEPVDQAFIDGLMGALPSLRNFAMSLTKDLSAAEDLVQETALKAIRKRTSFEAGTNLQAWLFTILKNGYFSSHRKVSREVQDDDGQHAAALIIVPDQEDKLTVQDLTVALDKLPIDQREAIILVGADGMSYEDAAAKVGVKLGTMKSRVNRARTKLAELMGATEGDIGGGRHTTF